MSVASPPVIGAGAGVTAERKINDAYAKLRAYNDKHRLNIPALPAGKPEEKPEQKPEEKPAEKPEEKKPEEKPAEKPAGPQTVSKLKFGPPQIGKIGSIPSPGGITLPLLIVLLMLFFVQQIAGRSRAEWFFRVVNGTSKIQVTGQALGDSSSGPPPDQQAGGDNSSGPPPEGVGSGSGQPQAWGDDD